MTDRRKAISERGERGLGESDAVGDGESDERLSSSPSIPAHKRGSEAPGRLELERGCTSFCLAHNWD